MLRSKLARGHIRAEGQVALTISLSCRRVTPRASRRRPLHRALRPTRRYLLIHSYE